MNNNNIPFVYIPVDMFNNLQENVLGIIGRVNIGYYSNMRVGDTIIWEFSEVGSKIETVIIEIKKYNTFSTMLEREGLCECMHNNDDTIDDVVKKIYRKHCTEKQEDRNGVLAFKVEKVV
jgi:ASC-1-like (ASCH) protein